MIFPLAYGIRFAGSAARGLDPYVMAALIAQDRPSIPRSARPPTPGGSCSSYPATGRRLARNLGVRNFTTARLTDPELNIRLGTCTSRASWSNSAAPTTRSPATTPGKPRGALEGERPRLDEDEFIDDIPFPETQNYVKRILGRRKPTGCCTASAVRPRPASAASLPLRRSQPLRQACRVQGDSEETVTTKKPTTKKPAAKTPPKKTTTRK